MIRFSRQSEREFASYLDGLGLYWDYERAWGPKHPDFTVYSDLNKTKIIAVVEVEDIEHTKAEKEMLTKTKFLTRSGHPNTDERAKINSAREQLKYAKDYPCFLVINDHTRPPLPPVLTLASMLGDLTISFPIRTSSADKEGKTLQFFGKQGKMIDEKGKRLQNTTITAIGYIEKINPDVIRSRYGEMVRKVANQVSDWQDKKQTTQYLEEAERLLNKLEKKGFDFNKTAISVNFVLNPYRRKKFPLKAFSGKYTSVYFHSRSRSKILTAYDWSKS